MLPKGFCRMAAAGLMLGAFAGCSTPEPVRLVKADYPELPASSFAAKLRAKAKVDPDLRVKMFWGNYGGPGNRGGPPRDEMDWLFYGHDLSYLQGVRLRELRASDRQLVRDLKKIDAGSLSLRGRAYRERAMLYFRLPISRWIGKPTDVLLRTKRGPAVIWTDEP